MESGIFVPRDYDVFAGLDVDKKSISVTFSDHQGLIKSVRMPYSVEQSTMFANTTATRGWRLPMRPGRRGMDCTTVGWPNSFAV